MNTNQRGIRAIGKILSSMLLALVLVVGCLPMNLHTEKAAAAEDKIVIKLGNAKYYSDGYFGYEKATVSSDTKIFTMEISIDKGMIYKDENSWEEWMDWEATDRYTRSVTWSWEKGISTNQIQEIIQNLKFGPQGSIDEKTGKITFSDENINGMQLTIRLDGNYSKLPSDTFTVKARTLEDGTIHYYMHVNHGSNISWSDAYNAAKSTYYMGLRGYLVTCTNLAEDQFLDQITGEQAWAGGVRIDDSVIKNTNLDPAEWNWATYTHNDSNTSQTSWVWACGPEGKDKQYIKMRSDYADKSNISHDYACEYQKWNSKEPNNSSGEWCMEVHFSNNAWNDYSNTQSVTGYFIEFSDYEGGKFEGTATYPPYNAGYTVAKTFSLNHTYLDFETDGNAITTSCAGHEDDSKMKCNFTPKLTLQVSDGENVKKVAPVVLTKSGMWTALVDCAYVGSKITYKGVDNNYDSTDEPKSAGNYKAYQTVTITNSAGKNESFDLYTEFSLDNKGEIHDEATHVHRWKTTVENGVVYIQCVSNYGDRSSECDGKVFKVQTDIDTEADPSENPEYITAPEIVAMNDGGDVSEDLDLPVVTYKYIKVDATGTKTKDCGTTPPTTEGIYRQIILIDGEEVNGYTEYTITKNEKSGELGINKTYRYEYSGAGIDRSKGYIIYAVSQKEGAAVGNSSDYGFVQFVSDEEAGYDANHEDLKNYGHNPDGTTASNVYLDMYNQTIKLPDGYKVAAYKTKANGSWTAISGGKTFESNYLSKIFTGGAEGLTITSAYDTKTKKSTGTEYYFSKISKPSNVEGLRACYDVCADETGVTNGQFVFMTTGKNKRVLYNIGSTYEISFADPMVEANNDTNTKKIKWTNPWGLWPSTGGVWVPDALTDADGNAKAGKYTFYLRTKASVLNNSNGTMIYTAASKEKKVTISTVQKAPKLTVTYGKKLGSATERDYITVKKGASVFFGTTIPDPLDEEYIMDTVTDGAIEADKFAGKTVIATNTAIKRDITDYIATGSRSTILAWTNAKATKPASMKQEIKLYERKKIAAGTTFTPDDNGKIKLEGEGGIKYEIKEGNKWKTSISMPKEATTKAFEIRLKNTAKSGKESLEGSDNMTTIGVTSILEVEFIKDNKKVKVQSAVVKDMPKDEE